MPRTKSKIELPTVLTEKCWFYKDNEELCKPHLGKFYISYSSVDGFLNYIEDFIKQKFVGLKLPDSIYASFGSYVGHALEHGKFPDENPYGFTGQENFNIEAFRPEGAEYERMILIDMGEYVILGFVDRFTESKEGCQIVDLKTGGKNKEKAYQEDDYIQTVLYAHEIESKGKKISSTDILFVRREGSHVNLPLKISEEQFFIPLEYNEKRVKYALAKVDKAVKEISEYWKVYKKYFC